MVTGLVIGGVLYFVVGYVFEQWLQNILVEEGVDDFNSFTALLLHMVWPLALLFVLVVWALDNWPQRLRVNPLKKFYRFK